MLKNLKISLRQKIILVIFGVFLSLALLEIGLHLGGFILSSLQERRNTLAIMRQGTCRIMCLGESTTAGGKQSYPYQLEEVLNQANIGIRFSVINGGVPGAVTSGIVERLEANLNKYKPDIVITMMGINDLGKHIPYEERGPNKPKLFREYFKTYKLFKFILMHAKAKIREIKSAISGGDIKNNIYNLSGSRLSKPFEQNKRISHEKDLKRKIKLNPQNEWAYLELAEFYRIQGLFLQAQEELERAAAINPKNSQVYFKLGEVYMFQNKMDKSEEFFLKALEFNPTDSWIYINLGKIYDRKKDVKQAKKYYEKSVESDPHNVAACLELAWIYEKEGKFSQAEELLQKTIVVGPGEEMRYGAMEILYREIGNLELSNEYERKAEELLRKFYLLLTAENYLRLKQVLDARGIKYVCMQYPMRSIVPLRRIFNVEKGVVFIDNESVFKSAVEKEGYNKYFKDMFGGDFGHCTLEGNRLIAEHAANVILKEYFNK